MWLLKKFHLYSVNNTENGKKVPLEPVKDKEKTPQNEEPSEKVANVQVSASLEKSPEKAPSVEKVVETPKPKEETKVEEAKEEDEEMPDLEDPDVKAVTAKLQKGFFARRLKKGPPPLPKKPQIEKSPLPKEGSKSPLPKMGSKEKSPSLEIGDLEKVEHYMESPAKDFDADEDMEQNDSKQEYTAVCELQMKTNTPASSGLDQDAKQIRSPTHSLASSSSGSYR